MNPLIVFAQRLTGSPDRAELWRVARFVLVGGFNTAAMYGLFCLLLHLGLHYSVALTGDYAGGIVLGFVLNRRWTFASEGGVAREFLKYCMTYVAVFLLNLFLLAVLVEAGGLVEEIAQLIALVLAIGPSYLLQRHWVF